LAESGRPLAGNPGVLWDSAFVARYPGYGAAAWSSAVDRAGQLTDQSGSSASFLMVGAKHAAGSAIGYSGHFCPRNTTDTAPEIRRTLERLGRAGTLLPTGLSKSETQSAIEAIIGASARLSDRKQGALIVIQRLDNLEEYVKTGVRMDARVTPELLLQVFYPNTPLHDGAVIISGVTIVAASAVLPLSSSGVLTRSPERQMGLRHRAALGISEVTDAVAVVISEETGAISVVHGGRMIRRLDAERLENILRAFFRPEEERKGVSGFLARIFPGLVRPEGEVK